MVIINKYLHALVELHPVKDFKAESIAAKLVEHFRIFNTPQEIRTDRGTEFKNYLSKALTQLQKSISSVNSDRAFARTAL